MSGAGSEQALGYLSRHLADEPKSPSAIVQLGQEGLPRDRHDFLLIFSIIFIVMIVCRSRERG